MPARKAVAIVEAMRQRIAAGEWRSSDTLPNERDFAVEFGVARNTVRNAFAVLEKEGLISRQVGRGTIVKQQPSDELKVIVEKITGASPLDILNLRLTIEPQVAASAAINASARDLAAIVAADEQALQCHKLPDFDTWDNEFHARIYAATHNDFLVDFWNLLAIVRYREPMIELRRRAFSTGQRAIYCQQHAEIRTALQNRNADAARDAMKAHLAARKRNYFGD